jgi:excisionase family DNA binding protein
MGTSLAPKNLEICAITRRTIWSYVKSGEITASRTPGGHYRVSKKDLDDFIEKKEMRPQRQQLSATKILVVDDDPKIRKFLIRVLQKNGNAIEEAVDGFEAGQKTIKFKPDIMILDIFMPKMDGFEVCRNMKKNPDTKNTKIIAISGFDTEENREKILKCGADLFLPKPLDKSTLKNTIKTVLKTKTVSSA